jgi:hypothetical protein
MDYNGYQLPLNDYTSHAPHALISSLPRIVASTPMLHNNLFSALHVFFANIFKTVGAVFNYRQRLLTIKQLKDPSEMIFYPRSKLLSLICVRFHCGELYERCEVQSPVFQSFFLF